MSYVKTSEQLAHIRISCEIAAQVLREVIAAVEEGISTGELDQLAATLTKQRQAAPSFTGYLGYPAALCVSVNEEVVHGLPGARKLRAGDIVGLDFGVKYRGYFSDLARTVIVKTGDQESKKLIEVTRQALDRGIARSEE